MTISRSHGPRLSDLLQNIELDVAITATATLTAAILGAIIAILANHLFYRQQNNLRIRTSLYRLTFKLQRWIKEISSIKNHYIEMLESASPPPNSTPFSARIIEIIGFDPNFTPLSEEDLFALLEIGETETVNTVLEFEIYYSTFKSLVDRYHTIRNELVLRISNNSSFEYNARNIQAETEINKDKNPDVFRVMIESDQTLKQLLELLDEADVACNDLVIKLNSSLVKVGGASGYSENAGLQVSAVQEKKFSSYLDADDGSFWHPRKHSDLSVKIKNHPYRWH